MLTLYANRGSGSVIVEALFTVLGTDYQRREVGIFGEATDELRAVNPLGQVPTLVLDDGTVMTESVAITLWALEQSPGNNLAPAPGDPLRPTFLRWLVYFPAAIYPMYTVGDFPADWVGDEAAPRLRAATYERTLACWRVLESELGGRGSFVFGETVTALDVFVSVMSHWSPGRERIREAAPRLVSAAERFEADPRIASLFAREFGEG